MQYQRSSATGNSQHKSLSSNDNSSNKFSQVSKNNPRNNKIDQLPQKPKNERFSKESLIDTLDNDSFPVLGATSIITDKKPQTSQPTNSRSNISKEESTKQTAFAETSSKAKAETKTAFLSQPQTVEKLTMNTNPNFFTPSGTNAINTNFALNSLGLFNGTHQLRPTSQPFGIGAYNNQLYNSGGVYPNQQYCPPSQSPAYYSNQSYNVRGSNNQTFNSQNSNNNNNPVYYPQPYPYQRDFPSNSSSIQARHNTDERKNLRKNDERLYGYDEVLEDDQSHFYNNRRPDPVLTNPLSFQPVRLAQTLSKQSSQSSQTLSTQSSQAYSTQSSQTQTPTKATDKANAVAQTRAPQLTFNQLGNSGLNSALSLNDNYYYDIDDNNDDDEEEEKSSPTIPLSYFLDNDPNLEIDDLINSKPENESGVPRAKSKGQELQEKLKEKFSNLEKPHTTANLTRKDLDFSDPKINISSREDLEALLEHSNVIKNHFFDFQETKAQHKSYEERAYLNTTDRSSKLALEDKLKELEDKETEFFNCMESLSEKAHSLSKSSSSVELFDLKRKLSIEMQRLSSGLPIYAKKSLILQEIEKPSQFYIISAETGSGKSTQLPQYLLESLTLDPTKKILVSQPRKIAAVTLAQRVAQETQTKPQELVACHVSSNNVIKPTARIIFAIDSLVVDEIEKDEALSQYSCVIIDEAHERKINTDLLFGLLKRVTEKRKDLKVIVTSATLDEITFSKYFNCSMVKIPGRVFPIQIKYQPVPEISDVKDEVELLVKKLIYTSQTPANPVEAFYSRRKLDGHILVFLAGVDEIELIAKKLSDYIAKEKLIEKYLVLPLHGKLTSEDQMRVFKEAPQMKIILATRIAENSVTIKNITTVIDSGFDREIVYDPVKKINIMVHNRITRAAADQRAGRAGRTREGTCYRLYSEYYYNTVMLPYKTPEIQRLNLDQVILKIKLFNYKDISDFNFIERPDPTKLQESLTNLIRLKAVLPNTQELTANGKDMAKLNIDPAFARAILEGVSRGCADQIIKIVALLIYGTNLFLRGFDERKKEEADIKKHKMLDPNGDLLTLLSVYEEWEARTKESSLTAKAWAEKKNINLKSLTLARELFEDLKYHIDKIKARSKPLDDPESNLQLVVPTKPDYHSKRVEIINKCFLTSFSPNLCLYTGNSKVGFTLIKDEKIVQVHGSSALAMQSSTTELIMCLEISRYHYYGAKYVSIIEKKWIEDLTSLIDDKDLLQKIESIKPFKSFQIPGMTTALLHTFNRKINPKVKELIQKLDIYIDTDFQSMTMTIYTREDLQTTKEQVEDTIAEVKKQYENDEIQHPIAGTTRAIVVNGAKVVDLKFPKDFDSDTVHLTDVPDEYRRMATSTIYNIGPIKDIKWFAKKVKKQTILDIEVRYCFAEHAATLKTALSIESEFPCKIKEIDNTKKNVEMKSEDPIRLKLTWYEGSSNRVAHFFTKDEEEAQEVIDLLKNEAIDGIKFTCKAAYKDKKKIMLREIPTYYDETLLLEYLKSKLKKKPKFVTIYREPSACKKVTEEQVRNLLGSELANKEQILDITITKPPAGKQRYDHHAYVGVLGQDNVQALVKKFDKKLHIFGNQITRVEIDTVKKIFLSKAATNVIKSDLEAQFASCDLIAEAENKTIKHWIQENENYPNSNLIKIVCDDIKLLEVAYKIVSEVTDGKVLELTTDFQVKKVDSKYGADFLQGLQKSSACVEYWRKNQHLKVYTLRTKYEEVFEKLNEFLNSNSGLAFRSIDLRGKTIQQLYVNKGQALREIRAKFTDVNIIFDAIKRKIDLQGPVDSILKTEKELGRYIREIEEETKLYEQQCEICFGSLLEQYTLHNCRHKFCFNCLQVTIKLAENDMSALPIVCGVQSCKQPIALVDVKNLCHVEVMKKICKTATKKFILANSKKYKICPTQDCQWVYRLDDGEQNFLCELCRRAYCKKCAQNAHGTLGCEEAKEASDIKKLGYKACPSCHVMVIKSGGCDHMTCVTCNKHFCWLCADKVYLSGAECYKHLNEVHGGNGL